MIFKDKYLIKKIKTRNILHSVQIGCILLVPIIVLIALIINNEPYFKGIFAIVYSMILCGLSLLLIAVSIWKIKLEASIMDMIEKGINVKSYEIHSMMHK